MTSKSLASISDISIIVGGNVNIEVLQSTGQQSDYSQVNNFGFSASNIGASSIGVTVNITEARETSTSQVDTRFKQEGITVSIGGGVVQAVQTLQNMDQAAKNTSSDRMKALAAASAAMAAAKAMANPAPSVSASIGSSESQSTTRIQTDTARGSSVTAGGNATIGATRIAGASKDSAQDSKLTLQGSTVQAKGTTSLSADNAVFLLASANTAKQSSSQSSSSSSLGIDTNANFTLGANSGSGDGKGVDISYNNTQVGGKTVSITSAGDTTLKGAVVAGNTVKTNIGGNLKIESLQDRSNYTEQSKSEGGSVSFNITGVPTGASINAGQTGINSNYASVKEQSAIKAGDGGFQVDVKGKTDLKGGAITSTQNAIDTQTNTFASAGGTTLSDLNNQAEFKAEGYQVSVGVGSSAGGSAGVGQDSGNASSVTVAAISGVAGNKAARTGDAQQGIAKIFDAAKVSKEVNAQIAVTSELGKQAVPVASKFADGKALELRRQGKEDEAVKWDEGGAYRTAMYGGLGALTGGASGAAGAVAAQQVAPVIGEEIAKLNLPEAVRQGLTTLMGTTVGVVVGGNAGAATALTQTALNYVSHSPFASVRKTVSQENARLMNQCGANCTLTDMRNIDLQMQKLEAAGNLTAISQNSKLTSAQAVQLGENLAALLPFYGTPIALYQAISGKTVLSDQDLSTAERVLNVAAAAIPLGNAAYRVVTSAASDMAKMSGSIGTVQGFKSADELNGLMNTFNKAPAWKEGTQIAEATMQPGTKVQMVVSKEAYDQLGAGNMSFVGNWASFDNIPNQAFARNNLAITNEFKKDVGYVVELEITKPVNVQIGVVGSQGSAGGGANQMNFLFEQRNGAEFFKLVSRKELP